MPAKWQVTFCVAWGQRKCFPCVPVCSVTPVVALLLCFTKAHLGVVAILCSVILCLFLVSSFLYYRLNFFLPPDLIFLKVLGAIQGFRLEEEETGMLIRTKPKLLGLLLL